jgi:hypothetical protein
MYLKLNPVCMDGTFGEKGSCLTPSAYTRRIRSLGDANGGFVGKKKRYDQRKVTVVPHCYSTNCDEGRVDVQRLERKFTLINLHYLT